MSLENRKILIAYFSHAGENYVNRAIKTLETGNTKVAATMLEEITGGDMFFIDTVKKYPDSHMRKIDVAQKEMNDNARPELSNHVSNMQDYDIVFLCYPNWWGTCPMAVFSFLEEYDFSGKEIAHLCTHEGGELGHSAKDIAAIVPNAKILKGLAVQGAKVEDANEIIKTWALSL